MGGNPQFTGLVDCLMKTAASGGVLSMGNGFGVSVVGIIAYRGPYFGVFDTVRRRLQMQSEKPKEQWLYKGTLDCAVKIVKAEGVAAMFKGFGANVLRTLGGALVLVGYDEIKRIIGS